VECNSGQKESAQHPCFTYFLSHPVHEFSVPPIHAYCAVCRGEEGVCVCVCVCVRERDILRLRKNETKKEKREREREREREEDGTGADGRVE
jgi:hypothetical protein